MNSALTRYRVASYVVGCTLILFAFVAIPLKYAADQPVYSAVISPIHGFLYMAYLGLTFDLGRRENWSAKRIALLMLAGVVPFLSFYAERRAVAWARTPELTTV